ncbi:MAG: tetratricopeptide repeat protein [Candidatus Cloacimonadota bacterium]|nr:MAG: tetratricopeptide repeat protein [Candidatus Cloacimonadota bacterium]
MKLLYRILILSVLIGSICVQGSVRDYSGDFKLAEQLFEEQDWELALKRYNTLVKHKQIGPEAQFRVGECLYNLMKYDDAIKVFKKTYKRNKDTYLAPEALYGIGLCFIALKDWKKAEEYIFTKLAAEYPGYKYAKKTLMAEGILLFGKGDYNSAVEKLVDIDTKEGLFYRAKAYFALKRYLKALQSYKELIKLYPQSDLAKFAYYGMGDVLYFSGDFKGALYRYDIFLTKYPRSELKDYAKFKLAVCYHNQEDYLTTIEYLRPLLRHKDRFLASHSNYVLGQSYLELENYEEAIKAFQRVSSSYPNQRISALASLRLGRTYTLRGDSTQALIVFKQLSTLYRTGDFAGFGDYLAGSNLFLAGRYEEALDHFKHIVSYYERSQLIDASFAMLLRTYNHLANYEMSIAIGNPLLKRIPFRKEGNWYARGIFYLADAYYYKAIYEKSKPLYQEIVDKYSEPITIAAALTGFGWNLIHENRNNIAIENLQRVISSYHTDTSAVKSAQFGIGVAHFNSQEFMKALDAFEALQRTIPEDPLSAKALFYAGKCYYHLEYYARAIKTWENVLRQYVEQPIAANAAFEIGGTYFRALKYDDAVTYYKLVINDYPESPLAKQAQLEIANSYYNKNDDENAIREYDKFVKLYPDDKLALDATIGLERSYYRRGFQDPEKMKEFIEKFQASELAAEAQFNLGIESYEKQDYDKAIEEFRKVVIDFPESEIAPDAQANIVECYKKKEDYRSVITEAEKFLSYFCDNQMIPQVKFSMGMAYFKMHSYKEAAETFKSIKDDYGESDFASSARYNLALCYKKMGKSEKAAMILQQFGEEGSGEKSVMAKIQAGIVFMEKSNFVKALNIFETITPTSAKESAQLYELMGECYQSLGKEADAIQSYLRLKALSLVDNPYQVKGLAKLAVFYEKQKRYNDAIDAYQRLIQVSTNGQVKKSANDRIAYLRQHQ